MNDYANLRNTRKQKKAFKEPHNRRAGISAFHRMLRNKRIRRFIRRLLNGEIER